MNSCRSGAIALGSPENVASPWALVDCGPHHDPQNTRYTLGAPVVTPTPLVPPPKTRLPAAVAWLATVGRAAAGAGRGARRRPRGPALGLSLGLSLERRRWRAPTHADSWPNRRQAPEPQPPSSSPFVLESLTLRQRRWRWRRAPPRSARPISAKMTPRVAFSTADSISWTSFEQMPRTLPIRAPKLSLWAAVATVSLARNDHFQLVSRLARPSGFAGPSDGSPPWHPLTAERLRGGDVRSSPQPVHEAGTTPQPCGCQPY